MHFKINDAPFDLSGLSLFVGIPTNRDIDPRTVGALLSTQKTFFEKGIPLVFGIRSGNSRVERARDKVAWDFLASDCNRMLWLDSDQLFKPLDVLRLLCFSTHFGIVGAVYAYKHEPIDLIFSMPRPEPPGKFGLVKVDGMGLGFTMVSKTVMQAMAAHAPMVKYDGIDERMPMIFRSRLNDQVEDVGEDMGFFNDCRELGYDVWVDPAMKIGHIGSKVYEGTLLEMATEVE